MIKKVLIANRGEIAVRIIRACKEMDINTVAVYSTADRESLPVHLADEAVCIGPASPKESYLNIKNILSAAVLTGSDAIHPGFGFLSENSKFAKMCEECGISFIGPSSESIELMGNKAKAKELMKKVGVPVIPGSQGAIRDEKELISIAKEIGYPLMIKASAGGGGKGIRIVNNSDELIPAFKTAQKESLNSFGDDTMYVEKLIINPRHIEVQILGDSHGNVIFLGERDCSIQRRNQKVLEESPSPVIDETMRRKMGEVSVKAAKAANYKSAGTIEFLFDSQGNYYFMEMNTRIQVEHPITEMVTGIDLVKEQIKIASGEKLQITQSDVVIKGHAIECRINAESTERNFAPCPGTINNIHVPGGPGVRIDSAVYQGYTIPPYYDSMVGKLITYGKDRNEAICRMKRALEEFVIEGIDTNIKFQSSIIENTSFINGKYNTGFIKMIEDGGGDNA